MTGPIFDTHAHYSARAFDADRDFLLDSLPGKGVVGVCEQATHSGDAPKVLELAHRYPWVVAAVGIHRKACCPPPTAARKARLLRSRCTAGTGPQRCALWPRITRTPRW